MGQALRSLHVLSFAKMSVLGWWQVVGFCIVFPVLREVGAVYLTPCESLIYCTGELLKQVQMAGLFEDDKHFVDMPLKADPDVVLEKFQQLLNVTPGRILSREQLTAFVEQHFSSPGQELETWEPPDWTERPPILQRISDATLRSWAQELNGKWKQLGRKMKPEVQASPQRHSIIFVPNPLIVPGGRFIEYYYWDSFWIIEGLLLSNMTNTAKGMIENLLYLVKTYGHIPNGGRIYYKRRSQPPFLTLMVDSYLRYTNDSDFLRDNILILEAEYNFWQQQRAINISLGGKEFSMNYYNVLVGEPRPESYKKDVEVATGLGEDAQQKLWAELHSGAESGWDFSSRWFPPGLPPLQANLQATQTSVVVPVDLNAILCKVESLLALFYRSLEDNQKASFFEEAYAQRVAAIHTVLWNDKNGVWMDYNLPQQRHNEAFYPSNLMPLWAQCGVNSTLAERALQYLEGSPALSFPHGLPTSLARTGQQWDLPNAWAPLQQMVIEGLAKTPSPRAHALAFTLAQNWVRMNLAVYNKYHQMFEKYDVEGDGNPGGGGEYKVQEGFGWTNGVALQLLDLYGDQLNSANSCLASAWLWVMSCLVLLWSRSCL